MEDDPIKQTQEVVFSGKTQTQNQSIIYFNQNPIIQTNSRKHLGVFWIPNKILMNI